MTVNGKSSGPDVKGADTTQWVTDDRYPITWSLICYSTFVVSLLGDKIQIKYYWYYCCYNMLVKTKEILSNHCIAWLSNYPLWRIQGG